MNTTKTNTNTNTKTALFAYVVLVIFYYCLLCFFLYLVSAVSLKQRIVIKHWPFLEYQRHFYHSGYRHIWQNDPRCIHVDQDLIYSPNHGQCVFNNPEFDTTLSFSQHGRNHPDNTGDQHLKGIAIVGDSHAMGWGVNDAETFAHLLQRYTKRPVYNLAVSSYGTFRELHRLKLSGKLDLVDTVIIQYCSNDKRENVEMMANQNISLKLKTFNQLLKQADRNLLTENVVQYIKYALSVPIKALFSWSKKEKEIDFTPHYLAFDQVIQHYKDDLRGKKVIVFYSNAHGRRFANFPNGQDQALNNLYFQDIHLTKDDYFAVDDHLTTKGHQKVAAALSLLIDKN